MTDERLVALIGTEDGYRVLAGPHQIDLGEVYRERQRTDRYRFQEAQRYMHGRTRWVHSWSNAEDFATRREAVADLIRLRYPVCPHCEVRHTVNSACADSGMPLDAPL